MSREGGGSEEDALVPRPPHAYPQDAGSCSSGHPEHRYPSPRTEVAPNPEAGAVTWSSQGPPRPTEGTRTCLPLTPRPPLNSPPMSFSFDLEKLSKCSGPGVAPSVLIT